MLSKNIFLSPLLVFIISIVIIVFFIYLPFQNDLLDFDKAKKVYYVDNISPAHFEIIEKFNKKYDGEIEVVPVNLPFHSFTTNDRKAIIARSLRNKNDGIDIFAVDFIWVPRFAKWAYQLDSKFDSTVTKNIIKETYDACYQNEKLIAFPHFINCGVLYYRQDIIRSLPDGNIWEEKIKRSLTWKEFTQLSRRLSKNNNPVFVFGGEDYEGLICNVYERLSEDEIKEVFYKPEIDLKKKELKRAITQLSDFIHKYNITPLAVTEFDGMESFLYAEKNDAVFLRGWIGYTKHYKDKLSDTNIISHMKLAPLPHFEGQKTSSVFGGWPLMISKHSQKKKEAIKFLEFIFDKENQKTLYEEGGVLPVNQEVYDDTSFIAKHPELLEYRELMKWSKHRPFLDNYTRISEVMSKSFNAVLKDEITVDEALEQTTNMLASDQVVLKNRD